MAAAPWIKIADDNATELDARFFVEDAPQRDGRHFDIVWAAGGGTDTNPDYRVGLELLLRRVARARLRVDGMQADSEPARRRPEQDRQLVLGRSLHYPMSPQEDVAASLRERVQSALSKVTGSATSRLRIRVSNATDADMPRAVVESMLRGGSVPVPGRLVSSSEVAAPASDDEELVLDAVRPRRRGARGQGRGLSVEAKKAIELHAVGVARAHYEAALWIVRDVGDDESFDLLCTRGTEERHVEVKGTKSRGETVNLTTNEVTHAGAGIPVDLFIVHGVELDAHNIASGGTPLIFEDWVPEALDLTPLTYRYRVPRKPR